MRILTQEEKGLIHRLEKSQAEIEATFFGVVVCRFVNALVCAGKNPKRSHFLFFFSATKSSDPQPSDQGE